jgi:hypothetical protein
MGDRYARVKEKKMKKSIIAVFMTLMCAVVFAQNAASDFEINAAGTITKYKGWGTTVVIPETINGVRVTAIGRGAFTKNDLTSVTIPNSVTSIGNEAFSNNKLTSVTIPGNGVIIGSKAFLNNPITSITLGNNHVFSTDIVSAIKVENRNVQSSLFYNYVCNDRKAGTYATNRAVGNVKKDGDFQYIETQYGAYVTGYTGSSGNRLIIPSKIANLPVKALSGFRGISRVQIPDSVTYIGEEAFWGSKLTSVIIPDSVTYIGEIAFRYNQLTSVTIPDSVTYIGVRAFSGNQLTSVTIGNGVTSIVSSAFEDNQLTSVTIPDSVTYIGDEAFAKNKLTSVTIGENVTLSQHPQFSSFERNFDSFYTNNGKTAGTYVRSGDNWTKQ